MTRIVNRKKLAKLYCLEGARIGVEIGVADGKFSELIMQYNPDLTLYGVDSYRPLAGYSDYKKLSTFAQMEINAKAALAKYSNYHFVKKLSMEAIRDFNDNSLDFVYIDANHNYEFVKQDIEEWSKKVRTGGILSGHDFDIDDVRKAVMEFALRHHYPFEVTGFRPRSWILIKT